ncbi:M14 family zinc carboxypeptidase [Streptoalloteichus hindustanus]|uniref:Zinc carboxypeptidase n=1 Tax=Streptoalloteichus hindustanus TaxID=2017 RepID=A0A1M5PES2_STRHI|nr:M14 family zinc carboxypeptidase [Streptoalloteichus hindustanus]SHH00245.1 Zinc carboxypeptidase [Streptoalloteichus hindustanus]
MLRRPTRTRRALAATAAALAAVTALAVTAPASAATDPAAAPTTELLTVTSPGEDPALLAQRLVESGLDVVTRDGDKVVVVGSEHTREQLDQLGVQTVHARPVPVAAPTESTAAYPLPSRLADRQYPTFYGGYRTVQGFHQFVADVAQRYPELARRVSYGDSWQRTQDRSKGNELTALCLTARPDQGCQLRPDSAKPRFLLMAQIHAREITTGETAWRFVTRLLDGYRADAEVTAVLDGTEVWVVPQVNPDGIETVQEGLGAGDVAGSSRAWQRKNRDDSNSEPPCAGPWQVSQEGIDLNRNWDSHWGGAGTSKNPCSLVYPGPKPASEPETTALAALFERLFPDQRGPADTDAAPANARGAMVTLHTYGNLVLFPWGHDKNVKTPNDAGLRSMAFRMSHFNGYNTGQPGEVLYNASGGTDDWTYDKLGIASFTYEIGPGSGDCTGFFPEYRCQDKFWELNGSALLYAAKSARSPYTTSLGPTISNVNVQRAHGPWASVGAKADDNAYGGKGVNRPAAQKVVAAEAYVGKAPWEGGVPQTLRVNGDGSTVDVGGVFDATGDTGEHRLVYVRAKDADGNWGPVTAAWLPPRSND